MINLSYPDPLAAGAMSGSFSSPDLAAPSLPPPPQPTSSFGRLLARMGLGSGGEAAEGGVKLIGGGLLGCLCGSSRLACFEGQIVCRTCCAVGVDAAEGAA